MAIVGEFAISDVAKYNEMMSQSVDDKLFFLDFIKGVSSILDFGCADGTMLKKIKNINPKYKLFGYDLDPEMISLARKTVENSFFSTNWNSLLLAVNPEETVFNASSVIHEVYSYSSQEDIELFWERCFNTGFKYITIRDMMISESADRPSDLLDMAKVIFNTDNSFLKEFEAINGSITKNKNLIHYLLKYRYTENWTREVRENYLPISLEQLLAKIPNNYEIDYLEHYTLPFLNGIVNEDFGIDLTENTHVKLVLRKK